jgi:hypothetical protein
MPKIPIESEATKIIKIYTGTNDYILYYKKMLRVNPYYLISRELAKYVIKNQHLNPTVMNKWVDIHPYSAYELQKYFKKDKAPEKIFVNKVLAVKPNESIHVWGKMFEEEVYYYSMFITTSAFTKVRQLPAIDWSKYKNRPPKKHQIESVEALIRNPKFILALDMGLGKSYASIIAAKELNFNRTLIVCPATLKLNWKKELMIAGEKEKDIAVVDGNDWKNAKWVIINYDILRNFHHMPQAGVKASDLPLTAIQIAKFDLVIADECFPYKTIVKTNIGDLPIGRIVEEHLNVKVLSYNEVNGNLEYKEIDRFIKKNNSIVLKLSLNNGLFIECTQSHKIYVHNKGYIEADKIKINDELFSLPERINKKTNTEREPILFPQMFRGKGRQTNYYTTQAPRFGGAMPVVQKRFPCQTAYGQRTAILQSKLFSKLENDPTRNTSQTTQHRNTRKNTPIKYYGFSKQPTAGDKYLKTNEEQQPYVKARSVSENAKIFTRGNFFISGRKWTNNTATAKIKKCAGLRMGNGTRNLHSVSGGAIPIATDIIQSRYREFEIKDCDRSRWAVAYKQEVEILGQKKNRSFKRVRVESVEVLESGSGQSNRKLFDGDTSVYNIEVRDTHNYFADDILVSNCHRLKDASSNRSKIFNNFVYNIPNRWLLTGTPITNKPIDYFNLLQICESPLADNWQRYVKTYCNGKRFTNRSTGKKYWVAGGHSNLDELRKYTQNLILRRMKTEVEDLPDKIIRPVYLPLTSTVMYDRYMNEYEDWLNDKIEKEEEIPPWEHLTRLIKIRQMLSLDKIDTTVELAMDFIEEGKKVVIFSCFTETLDYLMEKLGNIAVRLDGSMALINRQKSVDAFQNSPKIKAFCGNIIAGGVGITLTAGEVVIFNDLDWVPTNHVQAEDRVLRIGQKNNVSIFYPLFDETLDIIMFDALTNKKAVINEVMGDKEAAFSETMLKYVVERLKHQELGN